MKQKLPERNGGYPAVEKELGKSYGKTSKLVYEKLTTDNPVDLVRYQVANGYMGRVGLINSGGESKGAGDLAAAVRTAVINKRGGGMGLVWLARDDQLETLVALKVLPDALCHDRASLEALKLETKLGLRLAHPNIVRIYDFQQDDNAAAISMEYVDGVYLSQEITVA